MIVLSAWLLIEKVYNASLIGCLIAVLILILLTIFIPIQSKAGKRRLNMSLIFADVLFLSLFVMEIAHAIYENDVETKLTIPYKKLMYIAYFLFYLSVICLFFGIIFLIVSSLFKKTPRERNGPTFPPRP